MVAGEILACYPATLRVAIEAFMFLSEKQINYLTKEFMPRLKSESKAAMLDVVCHGVSIGTSAEKHEVTHQSLSKNLTNLKKLLRKITNATRLIPSAHLLKENTHALLMADVSFKEARNFLVEFCENLGGNVEHLEKEVKLHLDNTVTCIFLNPDESYEREWSFDQHDAQ